MLIRASAGVSQPARSVYCRSNGERRIGYATFILMPRLAREMPYVYEYRRRNRFIDWSPGLSLEW